MGICLFAAAGHTGLLNEKQQQHYGVQRTFLCIQFRGREWSTLLTGAGTVWEEAGGDTSSGSGWFQWRALYTALAGDCIKHKQKKHIWYVKNSFIAFK